MKSRFRCIERAHDALNYKWVEQSLEVKPCEQCGSLSDVMMYRYKFDKGFGYHYMYFCLCYDCYEQLVHGW